MEGWGEEGGRERVDKGSMVATIITSSTGSC